MTTILTIEDDNAIRQGIVDSLRFRGFDVIESGDGDEGCELALHREYDLLLLDLALPGKTGLEILEQLRRVRPIHPVIVLTAKGDESDCVAGLKAGADDYVVKPFGVRELIARVEAVLRRSPQRPSPQTTVHYTQGVIDFERCEVRGDQWRVELSENEASLLAYLVENRGRSISREELLSSVWGLPPEGIETRTIDMHVARLREKLRDCAGEHRLPRDLMTVRGKGYMWAHAGDAAC